MNRSKTNSILRIISLITTFALIIAINAHTDLSSFFYFLGGSTSNGETLANGQFNTFFISSLGITSFLIIATYVLIVRCETILAKVLIIIANIFLIAMVYTLPQERVMHNFSSDTQLSDAVNAGSDVSSVLMGTSDTTLLTIVLVHMVIMLISVIRAYKLRNTSVYDKASAYD
jgi:hypothetical protein